jgi:hypothetical protein
MDNDRLRRHHAVSPTPAMPCMNSSPNHVVQHVRRDARCRHPRSSRDSCSYSGLRCYWLDAHRHILLLYVRLRGHHGHTDRSACRTDLLQRGWQDWRNHHVVLRDACAVLHWLQRYAGQRQNGVGILARRRIPLLRVSCTSYMHTSPV